MQGQPLGLQLWDTYKDCREGCWTYRTGLLGLGQEWGKAETTREQFSEEILIGEGRVRNCFTSRYETGFKEGHWSAPRTDATVNCT